MNWLILRDVLNIACNIVSAAYKEVGGWGGGGGEGGQVNDASRHS